MTVLRRCDENRERVGGAPAAFRGSSGDVLRTCGDVCSDTAGGPGCCWDTGGGGGEGSHERVPLGGHERRSGDGTGDGERERCTSTGDGSAGGGGTGAGVPGLLLQLLALRTWQLPASPAAGGGRTAGGGGIAGGGGTGASAGTGAGTGTMST